MAGDGKLWRSQKSRDASVIARRPDITRRASACCGNIAPANNAAEAIRWPVPEIQTSVAKDGCVVPVLRVNQRDLRRDAIHCPYITKHLRSSAYLLSYPQTSSHVRNVTFIFTDFYDCNEKL